MANEKHEMTGLFNNLTEEQRKLAWAYGGDYDWYDPEEESKPQKLPQVHRASS